MDVYEAIMSRRTVRDFQERDIEQEVLKRILDAGLHAPSNDHLREWEFVIVNDPVMRQKVINKVNKRLTEKDATSIIDNWGLVDQMQRDMYIDGIPKQYSMLLTAGCLIIPCFRQKQPLLKPRNLSALNGFVSIWCCIENILIAAVAEGIHGVTRIPFDKETPHLKKVLHIPDDYEIPCYLALGYPKEDAPHIQQHVIHVEERMHLNQW